MRGQTVRDVEMVVRHPQTGNTIIAVTGSPLIDEGGVHRGGIVVSRDITQRERAEEEIQKLNADLELGAAAHSGA